MSEVVPRSKHIKNLMATLRSDLIIPEVFTPYLDRSDNSNRQLLTEWGSATFGRIKSIRRKRR